MDAVVKLSYAFLKTAQRGDSLINVSSALSLLPMPGGSVYSATKSFVTAFTECLWYEFKNTGIKILATLPGPVATPFHEVAGGSTESMDPKMVLSPKEVVNEALKKLQSGKSPSVVNGNMFKLFTKFGQVLPRKKRLEILSQNSPVNL